MRIKATDIRVGTKLVYEGDVWSVLKTMHRTPGKGNAVMQAKMRSLTTGRSTDVRFNSSESVEGATLDYKQMQYLYKDDAGYTFMDNETFEQVSFTEDELGDAVNFLLENMEATVQYYEGKPIGVDIPTFVEMEVVHTEPGVRGDTVSNTTKPAEVTSGVSVQVPLFIETGDVIKIDTRTGEYVTRISKA